MIFILRFGAFLNLDTGDRRYYDEAVHEREEELTEYGITQARLYLRELTRQQQYKSQFVTLLIFTLLTLLAICRTKTTSHEAIGSTITTNSSSSRYNIDTKLVILPAVHSTGAPIGIVSSCRVYPSTSYIVSTL